MFNTSSHFNKQVDAMQKANQLGLSMIKDGQQQEPNKSDSLFSNCSVCYGSSFLIVYQNGVRGAKRCPNAVWDEPSKKHVCHLNNVITGQIATKENKQDLLKSIRKLVFELKINTNMFLAAMSQFFQVSSLDQLSVKQLELVLFKLKLAREFKLGLIHTSQIPQQELFVSQRISRVA